MGAGTVDQDLLGDEPFALTHQASLQGREGI